MTALEAQGVRKTYGGVVALDDAHIEVRPGAVHALLGENGAGKSTLVKIMTGAVRPDAGTLRIGGAEVRFANTADASRQGVAVVSQELSLFPHLDVLSNLFPMREIRRGPLVDRRAMAALARPVFEQLGLAVGLSAPVGSLSLAQRQLVEIAKALITQPHVLLLDEPTSALEAGASERLIGILRVLRDRNVAVVYVSHILEEVMSLCDEVTVLRDGRVVLAAEPMGRLTMSAIVKAMLGDRPASAQAIDAISRETRDAVAAEVEAPSGSAASLRLSGVTVGAGMIDVDLDVRPGEVVGLAGLVGSGPQAVLRAIAGLARPSAGTVTLPGGAPGPRSLREAIAAGVGFVTGDRRRLGLMLDKPLWENITQVSSMGMVRDGWVIRPAALRERARRHVDRLQIRTPSVDLRAGQLSGGNQQKVVIAKWLDTQPTTLLLDDPTRGVDIGAKAEINGLLRAAAAGGAVVLLHSTDLEELASVCDRVVVFYRGRIIAELRGEERNARAILHAMNTGQTASVA
jgi:ABC-type sugar transport system ATPase subunit